MRFKRWYFVRFCLSIYQRRIKPNTKLNCFNIFMVLIFLDANKSWKYFKKYIIEKAGLPYYRYSTLRKNIKYIMDEFTIISYGIFS